MYENGWLCVVVGVAVEHILQQDSKTIGKMDFSSSICFMYQNISSPASLFVRWNEKYRKSFQEDFFLVTFFFLSPSSRVESRLSKVKWFMMRFWFQCWSRLQIVNSLYGIVVDIFLVIFHFGCCLLPGVTSIPLSSSYPAQAIVLLTSFCVSSPAPVLLFSLVKLWLKGSGRHHHYLSQRIWENFPNTFNHFFEEFTPADYVCLNVFKHYFSLFLIFFPFYDKDLRDTRVMILELQKGGWAYIP